MCSYSTGSAKSEVLCVYTVRTFFCSDTAHPKSATCINLLLPRFCHRDPAELQRPAVLRAQQAEQLKLRKHQCSRHIIAQHTRRRPAAQTQTSPGQMTPHTRVPSFTGAGDSEAASGSDADVSGSDNGGDGDDMSDFIAVNSGSEFGSGGCGVDDTEAAGDVEDAEEVEVLSSDDEPPMPDAYYSEVMLSSIAGHDPCSMRTVWHYEMCVHRRRIKMKIFVNVPYIGSTRTSAARLREERAEAL